MAHELNRRTQYLVSPGGRQYHGGHERRSPATRRRMPPRREPPLRSVHTTNFPQLLAEAPASLLVTTYQAGKLVILRNDGGVLNTHFRNFTKPMGLAVDRRPAGRRHEHRDLGVSQRPGRVPAAGCEGQRKQREARKRTADSQKPESHQNSEAPNHEARHDACFLPRRSHVTGDVQIHEMAWVGDELWFVNTRSPAWHAQRSQQLRAALAAAVHHRAGPRRPLPPQRPGDAGRPRRYVTALGETNEPGGWRANKATAAS